MKKILPILVLAGFSAVLLAPLVAWADTTPESPETAPTVVESAHELISLIERIGNWVFALLIAVAAVFLIYAGFKWVTAGGNPEEVNKARLMLINALIGVAIALLARGMVQVIRSVIGG